MNSTEVVQQISSIFYNPKIHSREGIERFSNYIDSLPESLGEDPFPLYHTFADGVYAREIHLPRGYFLVGKLHRHESMVYMIKGTVLVADEFGTRILQGPASFVSKPGIKRIGYVIDDVVWIDIHHTDKTTVEEAEAEIFADSYDDYENALEDLGVTEKEVRAMSEFVDDQMEEPDGRYAGLTAIKDSTIEGKGVFSLAAMQRGDIAGVARIVDMRTPIGRYTNHSGTPNGHFIIDGDQVLLELLSDIEADTEITVDYREARKTALAMNEIMGK